MRVCVREHRERCDLISGYPIARCVGVRSLLTAPYRLDFGAQLIQDIDGDYNFEARIERALVRSGQGYIVSSGSMIVGGSFGAAVQGSVPVAPGIAFGGGFLCGYASTNVILTNATDPYVEDLFQYFPILTK